MLSYLSERPSLKDKKISFDSSNGFLGLIVHQIFFFLVVVHNAKELIWSVDLVKKKKIFICSVNQPNRCCLLPKNYIIDTKISDILNKYLK